MWCAFAAMRATPTIGTVGFETFTRQLGSAVRARRKALGWTQEQLAAKLDDVGLDQAGISRIEAGDQGLRTETLYELAVALQTPVYRLLGGADPPGRGDVPRARHLRPTPITQGGGPTEDSKVAALMVSLVAMADRLVNEHGANEAARVIARLASDLGRDSKQPKGAKGRGAKTPKAAAQRQVRKVT